MTEPVKTEVLLKGKLKMNFLSQHQFDTATKNPNELYYVPDSTESDISASIALHNNSQSSHPYILGQLDNKISKYSNFSAITDEIHDGDIVEYVGATDSVSGFINGYFYQANGHQVTVGQILPSETTASSLTFTFDVDTYLQYWTDQSVSPAPTPVTFTFDGTNWTSTETGDVDVATLGTSLGITYTGTAVQDDEFIVALSETTIFTWLQKNVQPQPDLSNVVEDVKIYGTSKVDRPTKTANLNVVEQLETMPAITADNYGRIVQYIGATTSSYTNGYFYKAEALRIDDTDSVDAANATVTIVDKDKYFAWLDRLQTILGASRTLSYFITLTSNGTTYSTDVYDSTGTKGASSGSADPATDWGLSFSGFTNYDSEEGTGTQLYIDVLTGWTPIPVQPDAEPITSAQIQALWSE